VGDGFRAVGANGGLAVDASGGTAVGASGGTAVGASGGTEIAAGAGGEAGEAVFFALSLWLAVCSAISTAIIDLWLVLPWIRLSHRIADSRCEMDEGVGESYQQLVPRLNILRQELSHVTYLSCVAKPLATGTGVNQSTNPHSFLKYTSPIAHIRTIQLWHTN
jgi:hypothetical protein